MMYNAVIDLSWYASKKKQAVNEPSTSKPRSMLRLSYESAKTPPMLENRKLGNRRKAVKIETEVLDIASSLMVWICSMTAIDAT